MCVYVHAFAQDKEDEKTAYGSQFSTHGSWAQTQEVDLAASDDNLASPQVSYQLSSRALQSLVKRQTAPHPSSQDSAYPQGFRLLVNFLSLPSFAVISNLSLSPLSPAPYPNPLNPSSSDSLITETLPETKL